MTSNVKRDSCYVSESLRYFLSWVSNLNTRGGVRYKKTIRLVGIFFFRVNEEKGFLPTELVGAGMLGVVSE